MTKTYKLELEIVLDEEQQKRVVELARRLYAANPGSTEDDTGVVREISAEEFIDGTSRALMTVAEENPLWEELDVQVSELSFTDPNYQASEDMPSAPPIPMSRKNGRRELRKEKMKNRWMSGRMAFTSAGGLMENSPLSKPPVSERQLSISMNRPELTRPG